MAKLSAYDRTEIWRLAKGGCKYALMSDGKILKNFGFGWNKASIKAGLSNQDVYNKLTASGFAEVER